MKTYKDILEKKDTEILVGKALDQIVQDSFHKYFKDSFASSGTTAMNNDNYSIFTFHYGKDTKEFPNGIRQNDALSLQFAVDIDPETGYIVEFQQNRITVKPKDKYMAFSGHKLKVRKFRSKTTADLLKKLDKLFAMVNTVTKDLLKKGELDIHSAEVVKMIKKRTK